MLKPIHSVDVNFFKQWSTDMAYVLGFFSGDGCLQKNDCDNWVFNISIHLKDKEVLEYIKKTMISDHNFTYFTSIGKTGFKTPKITLKITSNDLCIPLLDLGLCERKTWNKILPNIPNQFKSDYLRGYFDADGGLSIKTKKGQKSKSYIWRISCCCKDFLYDMQCSIYPTLGKIVKGNRSFDWELTRRNDIFEICKFMYNGGFALKRKYNRYLNMPAKIEPKKLECFYEFKTIREWSKDSRCKVSKITFEKRLYSGFTVKEALTTPNLRPRKAKIK